MNCGRAGGTIYAFGDKEIDDEHWQLGGGAAGIGGAMRYHFSDNPYEYDLWLVGGECMQVVISGGTVYAHGSGGSAGIGGAGGQGSPMEGYHGGYCGAVYITGGRVFATSDAALYVAPGSGAGIGTGAGAWSAKYDNIPAIWISGGTVYAESADTLRGCMDIGLGAANEDTSVGKLLITGGSITTKNGKMLANRSGVGGQVYEVTVGPFTPDARVPMSKIYAVGDSGRAQFNYNVNTCMRRRTANSISTCRWFMTSYTRCTPPTPTVIRSKRRARPCGRTTRFIRARRSR